MRRWLPLLTVALVGCGSASHPATVTTAPLTPAPKTVQGHVCSPNDSTHWSLQCALPPAPLHLAAPPTNGSVLQGFDFAWGALTCGQVKAMGGFFGASYFDHDQGKQWDQRPGLVASFHREGCGTVGVWETTASRALASSSECRKDAAQAKVQAAAQGNTKDAIDFAIDGDYSGPDVRACFEGIHSLLGSRDNAYGSYRVILWLYQHHLVGHLNWQTYAWSGGQWLPGDIAPLEQYQNGNAWDRDRAIRANYGQFPAPGPTCDAACQKRQHDHKVAVWSAQLRADYVDRDKVRQHLLNSGCRVKHPRPACHPLFIRGDNDNAQIKVLRGLLHYR